jgi:hypothetical protein
VSDQTLSILCPVHLTEMLPSQVGIRYIHSTGDSFDRWYFRCSKDACHLKFSPDIGYFFMDIDPSVENPDGSPRVRVQRISELARLCPHNPPAYLFLKSADLAAKEWSWACPKGACTCHVGRRPESLPIQVLSGISMTRKS